MPGYYEIEMRFTPGGSSNDHASFEAFLDSVADQLAKLGVEPDYTAVAADLAATWTIDVPDASEDSLINALSTLRAALRAVGCDDAGALPAAGHEVIAARHLALA
ncbi:hypothetical protein K3U93_04915 [Mycobacterium malmoense]|uniref:Uncharacterized protein n=1 Tax=Mycobacterium malmoense TaxID=1780 RepID=A0ABX3SZN8_MYCMA|nr:hypothetical protein [Mycobacterium malmoense]OIN81639.1 hypothetical protein BMG05_06640 [Mycobacterium malmoense]ORA85221.1 hypothetical protein BST29_03290 [Mycobacterium malmoense]QZA18540.1 hypothetical protein K3U93_04915 [Mycobacterium malmoense]UNB95311.1 hypothetical protein H5T25_04905 [Mycobacterium malmoense]